LKLERNPNTGIMQVIPKYSKSIKIPATTQAYRRAKKSPHAMFAFTFESSQIDVNGYCGSEDGSTVISMSTSESLRSFD
jgi:hypothetical protein